ncbi:MAG: PaaI family thioesterase [Hyphomonas sp.]
MTTDPTLSPLQLMQQNLEHITGVIPWGRQMGFRVTKVERGHVWGRQPYKEKLIGDPETGIIHGGVITTFLDNLCGPAAGSMLDDLRFVATLDLRIDYMRPAEPNRDILGEAECYHVTRSIAFCRAWAYHESRDKLIASAAAAFAINKARPVETLVQS